MKLENNKGINVDAQECIEPNPTPLIKETNRKTEEKNIIDINMRRYPTSATSNTYNLKAQTFENGKPEEFLQMTKDSKTAVDGTGTTSVTGKKNSTHNATRGIPQGF